MGLIVLLYDDSAFFEGRDVCLLFCAKEIEKEVQVANRDVISDLERNRLQAEAQEVGEKAEVHVGMRNRVEGKAEVEIQEVEAKAATETDVTAKIQTEMAMQEVEVRVETGTKVEAPVKAES